MLCMQLPEGSNQLAQLACSRLLSATCVKQQLCAIKAWQAEHAAPDTTQGPKQSEATYVEKHGSSSGVVWAAFRGEAAIASCAEDSADGQCGSADADEGTDAAEQNCTVANAAVARLNSERLVERPRCCWQFDQSAYLWLAFGIGSLYTCPKLVSGVYYLQGSPRPTHS